MEKSLSPLKLSWQCHICKASFFKENLLQMHRDNFHRELPAGSSVKINKKCIVVDCIEKNIEDNTNGRIIDDSETEMRCKSKIQDCSKGNMEKITSNAEESDEGLQEAIDDEMAVIVVHKDGSVFMMNDTYFEDHESEDFKMADKSSEEMASESETFAFKTPSERARSRYMVGHGADSEHLNEKITKVREQMKVKTKNADTVIRCRPSFQCKRCHLTFPTKHERRLHLEAHSRDLRFFCNECGRGFRKNSSLVMHSNIHVEGSHHQCPHCRKYYRTAIYLKKHMKLHDPSQHTYQCASCPKRFAFPEWLRYHMRTHTDVASHVCSICGKRYQQRQGLKYHMLMHEGKKPHQCPHCGKFFLQRSTLVTHMRLHERQ